MQRLHVLWLLVELLFLWTMSLMGVGRLLVLLGVVGSLRCEVGEQ